VNSERSASPCHQEPFPSGRSCARSAAPSRTTNCRPCEKIAESRQRHAFHVLISTLLSARTQDATTLAASERLFAAASTPAGMAVLTTRQIEKLVYPVSFYRNKARHVRATCAQLLERFGGQVLDHGGAADAARRRPQDGQPRAESSRSPAGTTSVLTRNVHRISNRLGW